MIVKIINTVWVFLFLLFKGCANNDEPGLDEFVNDLYQPRTVTNYQDWNSKFIYGLNFFYTCLFNDSFSCSGSSSNLS